MISFDFPQDREAKPVRIYQSGRVWKIYAPGASYTMISRKTLAGARGWAAREYPHAEIQVFGGARQRIG